jgi:hypothetical protein
MVDDCADHSQTEKQKNGDSKGGTCSPFFACTFCAGFVQLDKPVVVPQPTPQQSIHYESVYFFTPEEFYTFIWQPPRHC